MSTLPLYAFDLGHREGDHRRALLRRAHLRARGRRRGPPAAGPAFPSGVAAGRDRRVVTWNGAVFDGPYLAGRADALGVERPCTLFADRSITPKYEPQPGFPRFGMHPIFDAEGIGLHRHVDVAYLWRQRAEAAGIPWSLKPVARHLGIEVIEVDRARMGELTRPERMAYNLSDVAATLELAEGVEMVHPGAVMPPLPAAAA